MPALALDLRPAVRADLAAIDALFASSFARLLRPHYPPSVMVTAVPRLARVNPKLVLSGRYFVAVTAEGAIVGAGGWSRRTTRVAEVRALVVDYRLQRQGIGTRLMARIAADAKAARFGDLSVLSARGAVPFYQALGFRRLGEFAVTLEPGIVFPAVVMRRQL